MAENVQWIKLKVGMFDGNSFKKIKRAKIGGLSYRDKLTAVWFELMDLAGKSNENGLLIDNNEIPYKSFEDIAIMLDREENEIELCMQFFMNECMIEIIDDVYCLSNFVKYQNLEGLDKIKEQKRVAQAKWRERKKQGLIPYVDKKTSTQTSTSNLPSISISNSCNINNNNIENKKNRRTKLNLEKLDLLTENLKNHIILWIKHKAERGSSYKQTGFNTLVKRLLTDSEKFGEDYVVDGILSSIEKNYQGVYYNNDYNKQNINTPKKESYNNYGGNR